MMDLSSFTPTSQSAYMTNATNYSYNTEENVLDFDEESRTEAIIYSILLLLALCGNVPVFISLIRSCRQRSRIEEMLLHLIIADLIVACVVLPLEIYWRITVKWIAGDLLCRIMLFLRAFGPYLSSMLIVCISIDRFMAIVYPMKMYVAHKRARCMLRCAWVSSFLCSLPQVYKATSHGVKIEFQQCLKFHPLKTEHERIIYNLFYLLVVYFVPLTTIICCCFGVLWVIWKRSKIAKDSIKGTGPEKSTRVIFHPSDIFHLEKTLSRTIKMTSLIIISFLFCWTPYVVIDLWYVCDKKSAENLDARIQSLMFQFAILSYFTNPLVYGCYAINFKASLKKLCHCQSLMLRSDQSGNRGKVTSEDKLDEVNVEYQSSQQVEIFLELREATPVRRPLSRMNPMDVTVM